MFRRIHIPDIYLTKLYFVRMCLINSHGGYVHYSLGFANAILGLLLTTCYTVRSPPEHLVPPPRHTALIILSVLWTLISEQRTVI